MNLNVEKNVRDLNFRFNRSCNYFCLWCDKTPSDEDYIVILEDGTFEKFDHKKAKNQIESSRLTIIRLEKRIEEIAEINRLNTPVIIDIIKVRVGFSIDKDLPIKLTYGQLKRINAICMETIKEKNNGGGTYGT